MTLHNLPSSMLSRIIRRALSSRVESHVRRANIAAVELARRAEASRALSAA
jgi:hypothetical protein